MMSRLFVGRQSPEQVGRPRGLSRGGLIALSSLVVALPLSISLSTVVWAAGTPDANLAQLEEKLFQHSYPKDTETQRIERVEKFVYGDTRKGSEDQRLNNLMQSLSSESGSAAEDGAGAQASAPSPQENRSSPPASAAKSQKTAKRPAVEEQPDRPAHENISGTKYPAVTAIEQKVFHESFETENIDDRLARLETKVYGKASANQDLFDRVDKLKQTTGIDVAGRAPRGSDWADEDEEGIIPPGMHPMEQQPTASMSGEDGMSFSGRDLRKDMQRAFGGMSTGGGGNFGMGSSSMGGGWGVAPSGAYGFGSGGGGGRRASVPPTAPNPVSRPGAAPGMGLSQQVTAFENEVFGKTYAKEPLPARLTRLESTVFAEDKTASEKPLPERVSRLARELSTTQQQAPGQTRKVAQRSHDPEWDELDNDDDLGLPKTAPARAGLGSIMNQMGNMMNGMNFTGGYSMPTGRMITDPSTGLLLDTTTNNLIDPTTGMVVGKRVAPSPMIPIMPAYVPPVYSPGMAMPPFNNGLTPLGTPRVGGTYIQGGRPLGLWP